MWYWGSGENLFIKLENCFIRKILGLEDCFKIKFRLR
jgi:hypothetical protein